MGGLVDQCGILAAEFQKDRREIFGGRTRHDLSGAGAAGEENEVEGSFRSSVVSSRWLATAATASGSKYFGTRSTSNDDVAPSAMLSLRMQQLPAARAVIAGRKSNASGPLKGPMISATP
jgi:hypothetical protein